MHIIINCKEKHIGQNGKRSWHADLANIYFIKSQRFIYNFFSYLINNMQKKQNRALNGIGM